MRKKYKFAVIATDVVIFTMASGQLRVLLIEMKKSPFHGMWAVPGGLVKGHESVESAAQRILKEKTAISKVYLEQLYTFGELNRDPFGRVVSVAYYALLPSDNIKIHTTEEYANVAWFPVSKLPAMAYDHAEIVETAKSRLQNKLGYTNIAYTLLPEQFTLSKLQGIYESIIGKKLDKRNFRKKILSLGLIKKTGKKQKGLASRPAELFCFVSKSLKKVEIM